MTIAFHLSFLSKTHPFLGRFLDSVFLIGKLQVECGQVPDETAFSLVTIDYVQRIEEVFLTVFENVFIGRPVVLILFPLDSLYNVM